MTRLHIDTVNGQAAHIIHNHGSNYFGVVPTKLDYLELAKQEVPPRVRGQIDEIAKRGDVTEKELWLACKKKVLVCKHGKLVRQFMWVDYAVGSYGMFMILCMLLLCFLAIVGADVSKLLWWQQVLLLAYIATNAGLAFAVSAQFFLPHRTGRLAMVALGTRGKV